VAWEKGGPIAAPFLGETEEEVCGPHVAIGPSRRAGEIGKHSLKGRLEGGKIRWVLHNEAADIEQEGAKLRRRLLAGSSTSQALPRLIKSYSPHLFIARLN